MKKKEFVLDSTPPPMEFDGFPTEAFTFLHGLKKNNNKEWFDAHRAEYEEYLREPAKAFVETMAEHLKDAGLPLVATIKRSLFRINRDIRFSKDKSPYKTHIGIVFPFDGMKDDEWTGMYLGMEPEGAKGMKVYVGGGAYMPSSPFLKRLREKIASEHTLLDKLAKDKVFLKEYPKGIVGASLVRPPKGYDIEHPALTWLKMKEYTFGGDLTKDDLQSSKLPHIIIKKFNAAKGLLQFFANA